MDSTFVRSLYSSLDPNIALFENAGGTQVPDIVMAQAADFYGKLNVQPGYPYQKSMDCLQVLNEAHDAAGRFIGVQTSGRIVLGPSATALNRMMAVALLERFKPGDEIIVTVSDHEANVSPWMYLKRYGIEVKIWNIDPGTFELEVKNLKELITPRTVLVAFPHISNVLGTVNDIVALTSIVHDAGALAYVDGVASVPHVYVDVESTGVDFYVYSLYKTFGPHMAALYVRRELLQSLEGANHFFLNDMIPKKFELGTPNLEGCAAVLGVEEYFSIIQKHEFGNGKGKNNPFPVVMKAVKEYEKGLTARLLEGLAESDRIRIIGFSKDQQPERRVPVVSFTVEGIQPRDAAEKLAERGIAVGCGHFYAYRLVDFLGLMEKGGVLRASLVHYNTLEEADRFLQALFSILD
ncbi:MAG: cysteine desulfurase-like protein [Candidatus Aminicenantes bacterium]|nr:cysteine desulfurase-like protein [Candidatus Aminicenantes bacterium]